MNAFVHCPTGAVKEREPVAAVEIHLLEFRPRFKESPRTMLQDADALPQLIGDWKAVDQWQAHINQLFYRFRGDQVRNFYQTFASADYRLAHALAADYFEKSRRREKASRAHQAEPNLGRPLTVVELGPGNGNLAACFLSHLKTLDRRGGCIRVSATSWWIGSRRCWMRR